MDKVAKNNFPTKLENTINSVTQNEEDDSFSKEQTSSNFYSKKYNQNEPTSYKTRFCDVSQNEPTSYRTRFYQPRNNVIVSYGLFLYFIDMITLEIYILLEQRRDTFAYVEVVRGIWQDEDIIPSLFSLMCKDERQRFRDYIYRELWDDLYVEKNSRSYKESYHAAKLKYEAIQHLIPNIIDTTSTETESPPWGFPKGRKNNNETEIECAIRETEEETNIKRSDFQVVEPLYKFSENFQGTNGKKYATHYFLARANKMVNVDKFNTPLCIRKETISDEVMDLKWLTYPEACKYLNPRRQIMLLEAIGAIQKLPKV